MNTPAWPASQVEQRAVNDLLPYVGNPRIHPEWQVAQIANAIQEWGWTVPILCDEEGNVIAGHGRILAAMKLGIENVPVMVARGWSDAKKRAYVIADNKLGENATWDEVLLAAELQELQSLGADLSLVGFSSLELNDLFESTEENGEEDEAGKLLALAKVTIGEPRAQVEQGDVWTLGRHILVVADVVREHALWKPLLDDEALFAPYAGPFAVATEAAREQSLLIVQPEKYIAGHIIDRFEEMFPDERVERG